MKEVVEGGRKRRFPLALAGKELKRRDQLESSSAWHFWWIILLLLQLDVDHNLLHSIMNYSYTNTVSFPGKPEVTKGWWQLWWLLVAVSQTRRTINTSVLAANYGATRHTEQYTEHLEQYTGHLDNTQSTGNKTQSTWTIQWHGGANCWLCFPPPTALSLQPGAPNISLQPAGKPFLIHLSESRVRDVWFA